MNFPLVVQIPKQPALPLPHIQSGLPTDCSVNRPWNSTYKVEVHLQFTIDTYNVSTNERNNITANVI